MEGLEDRTGRRSYETSIRIVSEIRPESGETKDQMATGKWPVGNEAWIYQSDSRILSVQAVLPIRGAKQHVEETEPTRRCRKIVGWRCGVNGARP